MKRLILCSLLFLAITGLSAKDKLVRCEGTYDYTYPTSMSTDEARVRALEYAIEKAIADNIGTDVWSDTYLEMSKTKDSFNKITQLSVRGEWVEDIYEPQISDPIYANNMYSISVKVAFMARPYESSRVPFIAHILRNGIDNRFSSEEFKEGDNIYISFEAPSKGYVAVFLEDTECVVCAVPYVGQDEQPFFVKKNKSYIFLNEDNNRFHITCGPEPEINSVHIVFSPTPFIKGNLVRERSKSAFRKWLGTIKSRDQEDLQVKSFHLKVYPRSEQD